MATQTTATSQYAWRPDQSTFHAADVIPDALILQTSTVSGEIDGDQPSLHVAYVDDADAEFVAEAAEIDESDPNMSEVVVHTGKISQLVRLSREQWYQEGTAIQLRKSVSRAIIKRADQAYLAQVVPTPPAVQPPAGLLNIAGVVDGGDVSGDLDTLVDLVADLQAEGSQPSHIVLDPVGWAELRKLKTGTDYNSSLLGAGTTDAKNLLLGLPVLVNRWASPYTGLVIDKTAVVSAVGDVKIAASEHTYFSSDSVALRATWRIGWNVVRPQRIGQFSIAGGGGS
ncbi:phage major capsid protein [Mycolicibacterium sp. 050232]|uniref:phage major capsid protein n=1 Tax=Mycolicibacterium sp. 050232 TaxID=3113982 RepID=UPI002E2BAE10|nr:phage major capsid protein [Mycolicibacterium sp. 050232]MED5813869.1 phage major capsid protein [Mycolicibacterium sp. 050232]